MKIHCWFLSFAYFLVKLYPSAVSLPPSDVILTVLACPLNGIIFLFTTREGNLSLFYHCFNTKLNQRLDRQVNIMDEGGGVGVQ
jgi:hypothetical protein